MPAAPLTQSARAIINATAPVVAANVEGIVGRFYPTMFKNNPEVLAFFNMTNQRAKRQPHALAGAVLASVSHLDNLDQISGPISVIAHKHCALGVLPEHYKIVHDNFLQATAETLGDAVTEEVASAWSEVLMFLAKSLIDIEEGIYQAAEKRPGGWRGIKDFTVTKVVKEAEDTSSLYLAPADGSAPPEFSAGQYLTICNNPTSEPLFAPRHYTISSSTDLRITSKISKTEGHPDGIMSTFLNNTKEGDILKVRPPFGVDTYEAAYSGCKDGLVFVTGGAGVTPAVALGEAAAKDGLKFVSVHSGASHPLNADLVAASSEGAVVTGNRSILTSTSIFETAEKNGIDKTKAKFFISGPPEMMKATAKELMGAGVTGDQIASATFGPAMDIKA